LTSDPPILGVFRSAQSTAIGVVAKHKQFSQRRGIASRQASRAIGKQSNSIKGVRDVARATIAPWTSLSSFPKRRGEPFTAVVKRGRLEARSGQPDSPAASLHADPAGLLDIRIGRIDVGAAIDKGLL
jgi:hypothetical protein